MGNKNFNALSLSRWSVYKLSSKAMSDPFSTSVYVTATMLIKGSEGIMCRSLLAQHPIRHVVTFCTFFLKIQHFLFFDNFITVYFDQIHPNPSHVHSTSLTHSQLCCSLLSITHQILFVQPTYSWAQGYPLEGDQPTWGHTLKKEKEDPLSLSQKPSLSTAPQRGVGPC